VTEAGLSRLEVDAFEDECGGVGPTKVVELGPRDSRLLSGRVQDAVEPIRVVEVLTFRSGEEEGVGVSGRESAQLEMVREEFHQDGWRGQGSPGGVRFGWAACRAASCASCDLFGDGDGRTVEVDPANPETDAFAPPKPEHRPQMHHQPEVGSQRLGKIRQLVRSEHGPVARMNGRQSDTSTR